MLFLLRFASRQRKLGKLGAGGASLLLRAGNGQQGAGKSGSSHLAALVFPWHLWNVAGNLVSRCSQGCPKSHFSRFLGRGLEIPVGNVVVFRVASSCVHVFFRDWSVGGEFLENIIAGKLLRNPPSGSGIGKE